MALQQVLPIASSTHPGIRFTQPQTADEAANQVIGSLKFTNGEAKDVEHLGENSVRDLVKQMFSCFKEPNAGHERQMHELLDHARGLLSNDDFNILIERLLALSENQTELNPQLTALLKDARSIARNATPSPIAISRSTMALIPALSAALTGFAVAGANLVSAASIEDVQPETYLDDPENGMSTALRATWAGICPGNVKHHFEKIARTPVLEEPETNTYLKTDNFWNMTDYPAWEDVSDPKTILVAAAGLFAIGYLASCFCGGSRTAKTTSADQTRAAPASGSSKPSSSTGTSKPRRAASPNSAPGADSGRRQASERARSSKTPPPSLHRMIAESAARFSAPLDPSDTDGYVDVKGRVRRRKAEERPNLTDIFEFKGDGSAAASSDASSAERSAKAKSPKAARPPSEWIDRKTDDRSFSAVVRGAAKSDSAGPASAEPPIATSPRRARAESPAKPGSPTGRAYPSSASAEASGSSTQGVPSSAATIGTDDAAGASSRAPRSGDAPGSPSSHDATPRRGDERRSPSPVRSEEALSGSAARARESGLLLEVEPGPSGRRTPPEPLSIPALAAVESAVASSSAARSPRERPRSPSNRGQSPTLFTGEADGGDNAQ